MAESPGAIPQPPVESGSPGCPYARYEKLRANDPVHWDAENDYFLVSTHDLVLEVLKNPADFRQWDGDEIYGPGLAPPMGNPRNWSPELAAVMADGFNPVSTLVTANPPRHSRYRKLANSLFSARRTALAMIDPMQQMIDDLIDAFPSSGRVDFVEAFAQPFPFKVIAAILQVPDEIYERFVTWGEAAVLTTNGMPVSAEEMVEHGRRIVEAQHYFSERLDERRDKPGEDVISFIANARLEVEGGEPRPLRREEQFGLLMHFVTGGTETTSNFLGLLLNEVLTDPMLRDDALDPAKCPKVVEEGLRLQPPVQALFRRATRDVTLGGVAIPNGAKVLIVFGAANRDEDTFAHPAEFDPARTDIHRHLAFGHGIHHCLGAPLARKESELALATILRRIPSLRLAEGQDGLLRPMAFFRGYDRFEVEFDEVLPRQEVSA